MNLMNIIQENIINHGAEEVNKDPLRSKIKNILDKYDMDYIKLRQENESDDRHGKWCLLWR